MKLHLGCLDHVVPGWTNTDITPHIFVARVPGLAFVLWKLNAIDEARYLQHQDGIFRRVRYLDARKPFRLPSASVDAIYSSHMLEHLSPSSGAHCVRECYRVLKPRGILRVAVPNLEQLIDQFDRTDPAPFLMAFFQNEQRRRRNRHAWHYTALSLVTLITDCGFSEAIPAAYQVGNCPDLDMIETRPDSLFVEATK
jgi:SAM-dependent methyltransferase